MYIPGDCLGFLNHQQYHHHRRGKMRWQSGSLGRLKFTEICQKVRATCSARNIGKLLNAVDAGVS